MKIFYIWLSLLLFHMVPAIGQIATIGSGATSTTSIDNDPIDGYYSSFRYQVIYTAAELTTAGMPANSSISSLGFSINGDYGGGNLLGYTIKMGHTQAINSEFHNESAITNVKNAFSYNPIVTAEGAFDMINFNANFIWNGVDNILIDICSSGPNAFNSPFGQVRTIANSTANGSRFIRSDAGSQCGVNTNSINATKPQIRFYYTAGVPCAGSPSGVVASGPAYTCPSTLFNLSCTTTATGYGITYQWQSSPAGAGTFTNIIGATSATCSVMQTIATDYRCILTCSGSSTTSNIVAVANNNLICYCVPPESTCVDDNITSVIVGELSDLGLTCTPVYEDRTSSQNAIPDLPQSVSTSISVGVGYGGTEYVGVWIDYDKNGVFDASEYKALGSGENVIIIGSITVPGAAMLGHTKMRVRTKYGAAFAGADACEEVSYGTTRDYLVNIAVLPSCLPPSDPVISAVTYNSAMATWTAATGTPVTYLWKVVLAGAGSGGTAVASGSVVAPIVTANITGLSAKTAYDFYVQTNCGTGTSTFAFGSFTTSVDCSAAPVLSCSTPVTSGNLAIAGGLFSTSACGWNTSGNEKLYFFTSTTAGTYTLNVTNVNGGSEYIDYQFKLASAGCDAGGWSCIGDISSVSTATFSLAAATQYYILLDAESASGIANHTFKIDCPAVCNTPISSIATGITSNSANANWTPTTGDFIIEYGPTATFTPTGTAATAGNVNNFIVTASNVGTKALTGLTSSTSYSYVVRLNCTGAGNGYSANSTIRTFTTYGTPPANDDCINAINLTPTPGYFTNPGLQNMAYSTPSSISSDCVLITTNKQDVWFKLTTDNDGIMGEHINLTVTPTGTSDIVIMLYGGSCGALTELECADEGYSGEAETIVFTEFSFTGDNIETRDNTVYYLRVLDYFNANGQFNVSAQGSTALPVNILSFDAKALNNKTVQLTWNVAAEVDVKEYTVERSNDNRNWSAIGSVKASQKSTYDFNDNNPVNGVNYYRLAVKDVNASVAFSNIRTVNFSGKGNIALYPNPANNTLYVSGTDDKNVVVSIYNEVGQIVNTLSSNGETIRTGGIDVSQLLPGAYCIQVKGGSGITTMRFVKQ